MSIVDKIVIVQGTTSKLMDGDADHERHGDNPLPSLLGSRWRVKQVVATHDSVYFVLETVDPAQHEAVSDVLQKLASVLKRVLPEEQCAAVLRAVEEEHMTARLGSE